MIDKKNRTILLTLTILTLVVTMIGATFAYFSAVSQSDPQIVTTSSLNINLAILGSTHLSDIDPTDWSDKISDNEKNEEIAIIPFTVTSDSNTNAKYTVNMSTRIVPNTEKVGGSVSDIKYKIYKNDNFYSEGNFSGIFNEIIVNDGKINQGTPLKDVYKSN